MHEFVPFNKLKACRYGQILYNSFDMYVGRSLELYGEFSEGEVSIFRQVVRPGDVVLDIGANIGAHTLFFARQVGPGGRVLAFEPQRIVFQTLCANMALNSVTNVWCLANAVGAEPGEITVPWLDYAQVNNFGGLSLGNYAPGDRVPVVTIDSFDLSRCNFLKIDVEGMEQTVLKGATRTLERHRPVLYVENDREDRSAALIRLIDSLGYMMYWHLPPLYHGDNFTHNPENVFGRIVSKNMLCLPKGQPVEMKGFERVLVPETA